MDDDIPAVLPQELPTGAAGWCQLLGTGDDRQSAKLLNAFRYGFEERHPLGADGQAVGGVLDVAARIDLPFVCSAAPTLKPEYSAFARKRALRAELTRERAGSLAMIVFLPGSGSVELSESRN